MGAFTLPEEIIGIPLWVPDANNYFQIEEDSMPNGDPALVINGAVNDGYKAILAAPTLSPHDIFNTGDTLVGRAFSMSCWLKLSDTAVDNTGRMMFGCSTYGASTFPSAGTNNFTNVLVVGPSGTSGIQTYRNALNNVASPVNSKVISPSNTNGLRMFRDQWFPFFYTVSQDGVAGAYNTVGNIYFGSHPTSWGSDTAGGSAPTGSFDSVRYLHIGGYGNGMLGRNDQWRMAKWAFHDHVLTAAERLSIWQAMYGTAPIVVTDNFNRASLGNQWILVAGSPFDIVSDQIRGNGATNRYMAFIRDLGTPNTYAQVKLVNGLGSRCMPLVRVGANAGNSYYMGGFSSGFWRIERTGTSLASTATSPPTAPYTVRLEAFTNVSNNVELRVYEVVAGSPVLRLSFEDTSGSRLLNDRNTGIGMLSSAGVDLLADDFECGTITA